MSSTVLLDAPAPTLEPEVNPVKKQKLVRQEQIAQINQALGNTLRKLRVGYDMSQEDLARAVGLSTSYISRIENGDINPTIGALRPLIRFFGMTWEQFMKLAEADDAGQILLLEEWDIKDHFLKSLLNSLEGKPISPRTKELLRFVVNQELTAQSEVEQNAAE